MCSSGNPITLAEFLGINHGCHQWNQISGKGDRHDQEIDRTAYLRDIESKEEALKQLYR